MRQPDNVDLKSLDTVELVERHRAARRQCQMDVQTNGDDGSFLDYIPVVAAYNFFSDDAEEEAAANKALANDIANKQAWCRIATDARNELNRRKPADVAAAGTVATQRADDTFGPTSPFGSTPADPVQVPTTSQALATVVAGDAVGFFSKLGDYVNPLYWLKQLSGGIADSVGLGDTQTSIQRIVGLLRLLLLLTAGVGALYAIYTAVKLALGYGLETQKNLLTAAPTIAKLAL